MNEVNVIPVSPNRGDSSTKLVGLGVAGVDTKVSTETHDDYRSDKGRQIEKNGYANRADCVASQCAGFREGLAKLTPRKSRVPKRIVGRVVAPETYSPIGGEPMVAPTLWEVQEEIRSLSLEGDKRGAALAAKSAIKAEPTWRTAILCCLSYWCRGGRKPTDVVEDN